MHAAQVGTDGGGGPLRLAEVVAALSLATDLGTGQPLEHALRTCLLSLELARRSGVAADQLADVYYLALLRFVGCTADAAETAAIAAGDDLAFNARMAPVLMGSPAEQLRGLLSATGAGGSRRHRVGALTAVLADPKGPERSLSAHCEAAQLLASRLGVSEGVTAGLGHAYERWDGKGLPGRIAGERVPAAVRVVIVARDADLWARQAGVEEAIEVVRRRSGRAYDPAVAAAFVDDAPGVLDAVASADAWHTALDAEPPPWVRIPDDGLDAALGAFGDFVDLKSPWLRGHSSAVAELAAGAARVAGLADADVIDARRAGLIHDVGRVGVPNGVWDHPRSLTTEGWEKVRLHTYLTERVLSRARRLAPFAHLAACHHERADGSGYHRGARDAELSRLERLLGAADAYAAMTEDRPHRPALSADEACVELRREAHGGRFPPDEVEAVIAAAGLETEPVGARRPADLTAREVEVLRHIARGQTNRQVAATLVISPKTIGSHVEHIYAKTGVSTRAGAALFAMEHGLL